MKTREELLEMISGDKVIFPNVRFDDILNILSAPTQEQLDCPYCYGVTLEGYRRQLNEDSRYIEEVKYCGVCGRKLGDE